MTTEPTLAPPGLSAAAAAQLRERLARVVGPAHVQSGDACRRYAVDGRVPSLVTAPATVEDVAACLAIASETGAAVLPWGGGTAQAIGFPPRAADLALDLRRLDRVLQYEPADLTLSVQAGITFAALDRLLGAGGQRLALDCARPEAATLGGLVAANLSGPRRLRYGTVRDQLIGVAAALTNGTVAHGGGRVVKNVSGYDMMKLYLGSLGTLGVLVELNFKVFPRPASQVLLALAFRTVEPALAAAAALLDSTLLPSAVVVLDRAARALVGSAEGWALLVGFEGAAAATARQAHEVREQNRRWGGAIVREAEGEEYARLLQALVDRFAPEAGPGNRALLKIGVLPGQVGSVLAATQQVGAEVELRVEQYADAGSGLVYCRVHQPPEVPAEVFGWALQQFQHEMVRRFGQSVVLSCPTAAKTGLALWGKDPAGLGVMRALKQQFDPLNVLNPGRFVGGI